MSFYFPLPNNQHITYVESNSSIVEISELSISQYVNAIDNLIFVIDDFYQMQKEEKITIIHDYNFITPECFKNINTIFINHALATDNGMLVVFPFGQLIYQLSHEITHLLFKEPISYKLRWLEEALCHLSSLFFLEKMVISKKSIFNRCSNLVGFKYLFDYYSDAVSKPHSAFNLKLLNDFDSDLYKELIARPTQAYDDNFLAIQLSNNLDKDGNFWKAIPYLHQVDVDKCANLTNIFEQWSSLSPQESKSSVLEMANTFI